MLQVRIELICQYILDQCIASVFVGKYLNLNVIQSLKKIYIATFTRDNAYKQRKTPACNVSIGTHLKI